MRKMGYSGYAALAVAGVLGMPSAATAVGPNCTSGVHSPAQMVICQDAKLARTDKQTEARVIRLGRRMGYGQYLGLRHWHYRWDEERESCRTDRTCLTATYSAQVRFLDRLQQCLDNGSPRRACLRNTLNIGQSAKRR